MTALPHEIPLPAPAADLGAALRARLPVLETARLRLRAPALEDFPALLRIVNGPRGGGVGGPTSRDDVWNEFTRMTATWLLRGHGWWAVTDREDGKVLGFVGLGFEPGDCKPELGYMLTAAAEGRGLAEEAAAAVRDHGFGPLGLRSMVSYVHEGNTRSIALATRLGARPDMPADREEPDTLVYRHTPPETRQ